MYKKETKNKEMERKPFNPGVKLLSIVIMNNGYKKRGKLNLNTSQDILEIQNSRSRNRSRSVPSRSPQEQNFTGEKKRQRALRTAGRLA